jgi:hypothetical protein
MIYPEFGDERFFRNIGVCLYSDSSAIHPIACSGFCYKIMLDFVHRRFGSWICYSLESVRQIDSITGLDFIQWARLNRILRHLQLITEADPTIETSHNLKKHHANWVVITKYVYLQDGDKIDTVLLLLFIYYSKMYATCFYIFVGHHQASYK